MKRSGSAETPAKRVEFHRLAHFFVAATMGGENVEAKIGGIDEGGRGEAGVAVGDRTERRINGSQHVEHWRRTVFDGDRDRPELCEIDIARHCGGPAEPHPEQPRIGLVGDRSDQHRAQSEHAGFRQRLDHPADHDRRPRQTGRRERVDEMRPRLPMGLDLQKPLNSLDDFRVVRRTDIARKAAFDVGIAVLRPVALK